MNSPLRIVYMGNPDFAVRPLEIMLENNYNVVAVVTGQDKPAGRGKKMNESAVKVFAREKNLPILQPESLKDESELNKWGLMCRPKRKRNVPTCSVKSPHRTLGNLA